MCIDGGELSEAASGAFLIQVYAYADNNGARRIKKLIAADILSIDHRVARHSPVKCARHVAASIKQYHGSTR